ncbi:MAG TPA: YihY/virulence factor BrkB family protein [Acidimicrobiia bacterium]|nr:YihY/virulence factor BrkB family protein [Acidimicrobiia bacterium]
MNAAERALRKVDSFQQGTSPFNFAFAVVKKYGDDRGGSLAAIITYYGFLALFPLLLLLVTVLALLLHNDAHLQQRVLDSALADFPIIGDQLRTNIHSLQASGLGLAIGMLALIWGSLGFAQAAQFAMAQIWNVEAVLRPNFWKRLARSLLLIATLGVAIAATTLHAEVVQFSAAHGIWFNIVNLIGRTAVNCGLYVIAFRVLTPRLISTRALVPGALIGGVAWTVLQYFGTYLVAHQLRNMSPVYGLFAIVMGLLVWIYLGAQLTLYAAELNVVRARSLWPRSIVQPPLTRSDREVLRDLVEQEARRPEQRVEVTFRDEVESPDGRALLGVRDAGPRGKAQ